MGSRGICLHSVTGYLLVNLGTPNNPTPQSVGKYLREFLSDPLVIDIPTILRWILVNVVIVPRRSRASSKLYKKIWTPKGSPLLVFSQGLADKVSKKLSGPLKLAMRYGEPNLQSALIEFQRLNVDRIKVLPLYPQYSLAATQSSIERIRELAHKLAIQAPLEFVEPFYSHPAYIQAVAATAQPYLKKEKWDKVIFSFHGVPERHITKTESKKGYCVFSEQCCSQTTPENKNCYRHQCYQTAAKVADQLGLTASQYVVGFQSRLGRTPWIKPYTDDWYRELPRQGAKRVLVLSPSFVADCLETLEEIAIRGQEQFSELGGDKLQLVPSLNDSEIWADAVSEILS